jgi:hypothetical protein
MPSCRHALDVQGPRWPGSSQRSQGAAHVLRWTGTSARQAHGGLSSAGILWARSTLILWAQSFPKWYV